MSAFRRPYDRVTLSDITNRSGQHQHVNYSYSTRPQVGSYKSGDAGCRMDTAYSEAQLAANVTGNQYRPDIKRLEMQGSAAPSKLNYRYNARTELQIQCSYCKEHSRFERCPFLACCKPRSIRYDADVTGAADVPKQKSSPTKFA